MTPFCLVVSGGSQAKDNDDVLLDVVLMFNGGPLGAKVHIQTDVFISIVCNLSKHVECTKEPSFRLQ
jgi:hypothetical protein